MFPGGASNISRSHIHENVMATDIRPHLIVVRNTTLTPPIKRETHLIQGMSHIYIGIGINVAGCLIRGRRRWSVNFTLPHDDYVVPNLGFGIEGISGEKTLPVS